MIVGRNQKFLSLCRLGLLSCSRSCGRQQCLSLQWRSVFNTHSISYTLQPVPFNFFVPRSHSKASKRHLSLTWKSLVFFSVLKNWNFFSKIRVCFKNWEFENKSLVSKIRVVNGNFFPKIRVWKPKFVFKTRSLKIGVCFQKSAFVNQGVCLRKSEFENWSLTIQ